MKKLSFLIYAITALGVLFIAKPAFAAPTKNETQAVMKIVINDNAGTIYTGSGVVINAKGEMITNYHVVEPKIKNPKASMQICSTINPVDLPGCGLHAEIVDYWSEVDLALLRLSEINTKDFGWISLDVYRLKYGSNPSFLTYVKIDKTIIDKEGVELTDEIHVLGYPRDGGKTITYTKGTVSGFERLSTKQGYVPMYIKTDAPINHGNSGGGAFDSKNNLVGIPTGMKENIGYLISVSVINQFLLSSSRSSYMTTAQSDLPPNAIEGVFAGFVEGSVCPQYSNRVPNTQSCQCRTGFFAVGNSCIVASSYCLDKGAVYNYFSQKCEGGPVKQIATPIVTPIPNEDKKSEGGTISVENTMPKSGQSPPEAQPDKIVTNGNKVTYFVGFPMTKTDLMNCLVVGNLGTKKYYMRGSKKIKNMSSEGKYCFSDEESAIKIKYTKVK